MAVGLPVIASPTRTLRELGRAELIETVPAGSPEALSSAIRRLAEDPDRTALLRRRAGRFASEHTRLAEAARLAESWRATFPSLTFV